MSKIIKLEAANIKRLQAVEITPTGDVVVIGGRNEQGKSSVLDSIEYALGGDPSAKMPVRRGEERARVVVDLGDLIVKRTFSAEGGTSLVVTDADGKKQSSPQAILDKLVGTLTFDPLEFSRQKPGQQAETLRALVGLDFTAHDVDRARAFETRTGVNREAKALEARIAGMPKHDGVPEAEVNTADILAEQQKTIDANQKIRDLELVAKQAGLDVDAANAAVGRMENNLASLRKELAEIENSIRISQSAIVAGKADLQKAIEASLRAQAAITAPLPLDGFKDRLAQAEQVNAKVRANQARAAIVEQFKAKTKESDGLTDKLEKLDASKRRKITEAKYPVPGLLFDTSGGVVLDGIPFEQCSGAVKLKVSVAVGLALNPTLKVLLIRDGSLLDADSMQVLAEMAAKAGAQIWLERVGVDSRTSVVIEDGLVAERPAVDREMERQQPSEQNLL